MSAASGSALSQPDRLTELGIGDGGFFMSLADFETAIRLGLRICVLVYNDAAYGAEIHHFRRAGVNPDLARFPDSDIAGIARSLGAEALTVRKVEDLEPLKDWVKQGAPGVFAIDAKISSEIEADWHREAHE